MFHQLAAFRDHRGGNFAIISAILAMPLLLGIGMALDYSTISRTRAELQNSLDSAVLAIAREGKDISDDKAKQIATLFVAQNTRLKVTDIQIHHDGTAFSVEGVTNAPIAFGNLFGYDGWKVQAASSADIAYASYEVGLVLDTTGSMAGGKLSAMKDAVNGLIDNMSKQVNDTNKLKFALIPFSSFVNVGSGFGPKFDKKGRQIAGTGSAWLDLTGMNPIPQTELGIGASRFQLTENLGQSWSGCVETREAGDGDYGVSDTPPDPSEPASLFVPAFAVDEPDSGFINNYISSDAKIKDKSAAEKKKRWSKYGVKADATGYPLLDGLLDPLVNVADLVVDLSGKKHIKIKKRTVNGYGETGPGFGCVSQPITSLSSDYAGIKAKVGALKAEGNTNIMEGVAWGMRVLSPGEPFSQGADPKKNPNLQKIMIVLTDGSNVLGTTSSELGSTYSSFGYLVDGRLGISAGGTSATNSAMNDRTLAACSNAKAQGMEVYTIRLEEPNVATGTMLRDCASVPENYFDVPSRSQLDDAFNKIKQRVTRVRISS